MNPVEPLSRFLEAHASVRPKDSDSQPPVRPFLTISREAGAGGRTVGRKVAELLNSEPLDVPWTVFDKELIDAVCQQHNLSKDISRYLTESSVNKVADYVGEMLGLHPSSFELVRKTNETIITLARMGRAVVIGRGANLLTSEMAGGFHVRLVASREWRLQHLQKHKNLGEKEAATLLREMDNDRRKYVQDHFDRDVEDVIEYDCVLNTGLLSLETAATMIADRMRALEVR